MFHLPIPLSPMRGGQLARVLPWAVKNGPFDALESRTPSMIRDDSTPKAVWFRDRLCCELPRIPRRPT